MRKNVDIALVVVLAFILRIVGIKYGLPLWLIDDEPPFVLATLKMLQLKTIIPALHMAEFQSILYYPPYLSYLYLPPFILVILYKYSLFWFSGLTNFSNYLLLDLSAFFIVARLVNVIASLLSIFLIYKACENFFGDKKVGLFSSFFLATNIAHIGLSIVSRQWLFVSFITTLVLYIISKKNLNIFEKYLYSILVIGIGVGFSIISILIIIPTIIYLLIQYQSEIIGLLKTKKFYLINILFVLLLIMPLVLYPGSFGFQKDVTAGNIKTLYGFITSPIFFLKTSFLSGPIFIVLAMVGMIIMTTQNITLFSSLISFIVLYSATFYIFFRYEDRFALPIIPALSILAGYGLYFVYKKIDNKLVAISALILLLSIPTVSAIKFAILTTKNDSRVAAIRWMSSNLPADSKILVYARLTRLPSTKKAINEQQVIDRASLRKIDAAEVYYGRNPLNKSFHALNLYSVNNDIFYKELTGYVKQHQYKFLIMEKDNFNYNDLEFDNVSGIASSSTLLASYGHPKTKYSLSGSSFYGTPNQLFDINNLGPLVNIYEIKNENNNNYPNI